MSWQLWRLTLPLLDGGERRLESTEVAGYKQSDGGGGGEEGEKLPRQWREDEAEGSGNSSAKNLNLFTVGRELRAVGCVDQPMQFRGLWNESAPDLLICPKLLERKKRLPSFRDTVLFEPWYRSSRRLWLAEFTPSPALHQKSCVEVAQLRISCDQWKRNRESPPTRMWAALQSYGCRFIARASGSVVETCVLPRSRCH